MAIFSDDTLRWEVRRDEGSDSVVVTFHGQVTEEVGRRSAAAFLAALGTSTVDLTFDVLDVDSHVGAARKAWQDQLLPRRKQLRSMVVVSRSRLTRMAATVFAMMLGIPCEVLEETPPS
jgi:hypothetical protein